MKKIIIGTLLGLAVSFLIFLPFWFQAANVMSSADISKERYCAGQTICDNCNRDFNCLMNKCGRELGDKCKYAEANYEPFVGDKNTNKEDFMVRFLCGNKSQTSISCPYERNKITPFFKYGTFSFALHYVALFFKVGYSAMMLQAWNLTSFLGLIILLIPIIVGFFIGLWLKLRCANREITNYEQH